MPAFDGEAETWMALAAELAARNPAYVHLSNRSGVLENAGPDFLKSFRDACGGTFVIAGNYDRAGAEADLADGFGDLVAFGRPYISNPDLVERLRNGWPLAEADPATFYGGSEAGYTDYPTWEESLETA